MLVLVTLLFIFSNYAECGCPFMNRLPRRLTERLETTGFPTSSPTFKYHVPNPNYSGSFAPYCKKTSGAAADSTNEGMCSVYETTKAAFIDATPSDVQGAANLFAKAMRLTWHDAAEFDQQSADSLGPDGCLTYTAGNAGLIESTSIVSLVFEPMWQNVCDKISRADFWMLLGKIVFEHSQFAAANNFTTVETTYSYGRKDSADCSAGVGRLPSAQSPDTEFDRVFVKQLGLSMSDAVTLLGAHTLGHVHLENSGYGSTVDPSLNPTTNAFDLTPNVFDNSYYQQMVGVGWDNMLVPNDETKNQWLFQADPQNSLNQLILLNTDMFLAFPIDTSGPFNTGLPYNSPNDTIANMGQSCFPFPDAANFFEVLSIAENPAYAPQCAANLQGQVLFSDQSVPTFPQITRYLDRNTGNMEFLNDFAIAFEKMANVGYNNGGKLGRLKVMSCPKPRDEGAEEPTRRGRIVDKTDYKAGFIGLIVTIVVVALAVAARTYYKLYSALPANDAQTPTERNEDNMNPQRDNPAVDASLGV